MNGDKPKAANFKNFGMARRRVPGLRRMKKLFKKIFEISGKYTLPTIGTIFIAISMVGCINLFNSEKPFDEKTYYLLLTIVLSFIGFKLLSYKDNDGENKQ